MSLNDLIRDQKKPYLNIRCESCTVDGQVKLSSQQAGLIALIAQQVVVPCTIVDSASAILLSYKDNPLGAASLHVGAVSDGVSFTVDSSAAAGGETISWCVINSA